jgi:hypothetical protein
LGPAAVVSRTLIKFAGLRNLAFVGQYWCGIKYFNLIIQISTRFSCFVIHHGPWEFTNHVLIVLATVFLNENSSSWIVCCSWLSSIFAYLHDCTLKFGCVFASKTCNLRTYDFIINYNFTLDNFLQFHHASSEKCKNFIGTVDSICCTKHGPVVMEAHRAFRHVRFRSSFKSFTSAA